MMTEDSEQPSPGIWPTFYRASAHDARYWYSNSVCPSVTFRHSMETA